MAEAWQEIPQNTAVSFIDGKFEQRPFQPDAAAAHSASRLCRCAAGQAIARPALGRRLFGVERGDPPQQDFELAGQSILGFEQAGNGVSVTGLASATESPSAFPARLRHRKCAPQAIPDRLIPDDLPRPTLRSLAARCPAASRGACKHAVPRVLATADKSDSIPSRFRCSKSLTSWVAASIRSTNSRAESSLGSRDLDSCAAECSVSDGADWADAAEVFAGRCTISSNGSIRTRSWSLRRTDFSARPLTSSSGESDIASSQTSAPFVQIIECSGGISTPPRHKSQRALEPIKNRGDSHGPLAVFRAASSDFQKPRLLPVRLTHATRPPAGSETVWRSSRQIPLNRMSENGHDRAAEGSRLFAFCLFSFRLDDLVGHEEMGDGVRQRRNPNGRRTSKRQATVRIREVLRPRRGSQRSSLEQPGKLKRTRRLTSRKLRPNPPGGGSTPRSVKHRSHQICQIGATQLGEFPGTHRVHSPSAGHREHLARPFLVTEPGAGFGIAVGDARDRLAQLLLRGGAVDFVAREGTISQ